MKIKLKNYIYRVILSVFSILLFSLILEAGIRFHLYFKSRKSLEVVMNNLPEFSPDMPADISNIICPSRYPGIIYEFRPNIKANFMDVQVETNSRGWRGKLYPDEKDKNTVRIVMIGDSHMFGWGVIEDKRYSNVLENMLNASFPERKWEIINTAVPGYNTYMEVETLKRKAIIYCPDIVIMEYIGNDLDLPNFIMDSTDYLNFSKSFFVNFLKGRMESLHTKLHLILAPLVEDKVTKGLRGANEDNMDMVPKKYRHMVGWRSFVASLLKLKKMQQKHNFDVIVCISHNWPQTIPQKIINLCNQLKFHCIFRPQKYEPPSLILSKEDTHPSALGHKLIAENIFNLMLQEKIVDKYIQRQ